MKQATDIARIVVAGVSSNVGKTTVTAGLIAALLRRGLVVQPFKCGPDYIDPSYHERASGRPCRNLDTWMLTDSQLLETFARACRDVDIAVIEGVMGLYDGSDWHDERGSTAQIAKLLQAPVVLVTDISGSARSAAAEVLGYRSFDTEVQLAAVVLNFAGSERHARGCAEAIERATGVGMVGWLPRDLRLRIPERHLGLVPGGEQVGSAALVAQMAEAVEQRFDVGAVVALAQGAGRSGNAGVGAAGVGAGAVGAGGVGAGGVGTGGVGAGGVGAAGVGAGAVGAGGVGAAGIGAGGIGAGGVEAGDVSANDVATREVGTGMSAPVGHGIERPVIAVARDEAFCFYYPENLELLVEEGARVEFFSPLRGERPPTNAAGVYLGGGYPELHGAALAANMGLWDALRELRERDAPIYAECGGFMVLTEGLVDTEGHRWAMAGLLPGVARMSGKLAALGYRHARALRANLLARAGDSLRGHEFRYSTWIRRDSGSSRGDHSSAGDAITHIVPVGSAAGAAGDDAAWQIRGTRHDAPTDTVGYARGNLLASYLHVHFGQRRELATRFVATACAWRRGSQEPV